MKKNSIWYILFWLLLVQFFASSTTGTHRGLYSLFTKDILLVTSFAQIGFVLSIFGLAKSFTNLGLGALSDRVGRKPTILLGLTLAGTGGFLIALSQTYNDMLIGTALMGLGSGSYSVGIMVSINEIVTSARRGLAMGFFELAAYGGQSFGGLLAGITAATAGLRLPFYSIVVMAGIGAIICFFAVPETRRSITQSVTRLVKTDKGVLEKSEVAFKPLIPLYIAGFTSKILDSFVWSFLPIHLKGVQLSVVEITTITSTFTVSWALFQPLTGHISDRLGRKNIILIGLAISAIDIIMFVLTNNFIAMLGITLVLGFGAALFYTPLLAMVGDLAPRGREGALFGLFRFFRDMGYFAGPILLGVIADTLGFNYLLYVTSLSLVITIVMIVIFSKKLTLRNARP